MRSERRDMSNRALETRWGGGRISEPPAEWWDQPGWVTSIVMIATMFGGMILFFYKTVPEVDNVKETTRSIPAGIRNSAAQAKVAEITAQELIDPARRAASELALKTARLQYAKAADELLDASTPDLHPEIMQPGGVGNNLVIPIQIKNNGSRGVMISKLKVDVKFTTSDGRSGPQYKVKKCQLGYLSPHNSVPCHFVLEILGDGNNVDRVDFTYTMNVRPYMYENSQSFALLQESYSKEVLASRLNRVWSFSSWYMEE